MSFSPEFIESVREASDLVATISNYSELKRKGDRLTGLCPFPSHNEKTPSFSVTDSKQLYYCFGCKKSGNIFHFLKEMQGLNFPEAVEYLANKAGIDIPKDQKSYQSNKDQGFIKTGKKVNQWASHFYYKNLIKNISENNQSKTSGYLKGRGITQDIVEEFRLGLSNDEWSELYDGLNAAKAPIDVASKLGLIRQKKQKNGYFDTYRNRLMFPIIDEKGETVGFGGRALGDEPPKYINSSDSDVFNKSKTLYGLFHTAKHIRTQDELLVVEGYMDLISLYSQDIKNAVAPLGTALTFEHCRKIKRFTKNVVLLFDGDSAGQEAAFRSLPLFLRAGVVPKIVSLPDKLDPDDYVKQHGVKALKGLIEKASDLFVEFLNRQLVGFRGHMSDKVEVVDKIAPLLVKISDPRLKELYILEILSRFNFQRDWFLKALKGAKLDTSMDSLEETPEAASRAIQKEDIDTSALTAAPRDELFLVNLSLKDESLLLKLGDNEVYKQFSSQELFKITSVLLKFYGQDTSNFDNLGAYLASFVGHFKPFTMYMESPLSEMSVKESHQLFDDCCKKVKDRFLGEQQKRLSAQLQQSEGESSAEKLEQIMNIIKERKSLKD